MSKHRRKRKRPDPVFDAFFLLCCIAGLYLFWWITGALGGVS